MKIREFFKELPLEERIFRLESLILSSGYITARRPYKSLRKTQIFNAKLLCEGKFVYDVLNIEGEDLTKLTFEERLARLRELNFEEEGYKIVEYINLDEKFFNILVNFFKKGGEQIVIIDKKSKANGYKLTNDLLSEIECDFVGLLSSPKRVPKDTPLDEWEYWEDERRHILIKGYYITDYIRGQAMIPVTKEYFEHIPAGTRFKLPDGSFLDTKKIIKKKKAIAKCIIMNNKILHPYLLEEQNGKG